MTITSHALAFLLALSVIWILSGAMIGAVDRVAKRYHKPGFAVAFFVLGMLTSVGEIAVALNATIEHAPQVSSGNLVGASIVIFLLIIPALALFARTVTLDHTMTWGNLLLTLCVVALPPLIALDGEVMRTEGFLVLLLYVALIYRIHKKRPFEETVQDTIEDVREEMMHTRHGTLRDGVYITVGAILIFLAGNVLVDESIFFTNLAHVPSSMAGLLVLSIGTNIPELMIGVRAALSRHSDIAFGDYLGSAAANTLLFSILPLVNGPFSIDTGEFAISFLILSIGLTLFFLFARTKNQLSRGEGAVMLALYLCFVVFQLCTVLCR